MSDSFEEWLVEQGKQAMDAREWAEEQGDEQIARYYGSKSAAYTRALIEYRKRNGRGGDDDE